MFKRHRYPKAIILQAVLFNKDPEIYQQFIDSRKKEVAHFILKALRKS